MQIFSSLGKSEDPWFRIGNFGVCTSELVAALCLAFSMVWAFEGRSQQISNLLVLRSSNFAGGSVFEGHIWRLITWPLPNVVGIWTLLLIAVFWMFGSQLEAMMGRPRFTVFLVCLVVLPALIVTFLEIVGVTGMAYTIRTVEIGLLVAFAAQFSNVRFWPGIPAWGLTSIVVGLALLQEIAARDLFGLTLLAATVVLAPMLLRAFGFAQHLQWLSFAGSSTRPPKSRGRRKRQRNSPASDFIRPQPMRSTHLRAVPPPDSPQAKIDALLDKVAEGGLENLTDVERQSLEELSWRLKDKRDKE